jgi:hypothetical protein
MNKVLASKKFPSEGRWVIALVFRTTEASEARGAKIIVLVLPPTLAMQVAQMMDEVSSTRSISVRELLFPGDAHEIRRVDWFGERREADSSEEAQTIAATWKRQLDSQRRPAVIRILLKPPVSAPTKATPEDSQENSAHPELSLPELNRDENASEERLAPPASQPHSEISGMAPPARESSRSEVAPKSADHAVLEFSEAQRTAILRAWVGTIRRNLGIRRS